MSQTASPMTRKRAHDEAEREENLQLENDTNASNITRHRAIKRPAPAKDLAPTINQIDDEEFNAEPELVLSSLRPLDSDDEDQGDASGAPANKQAKRLSTSSQRSLRRFSSFKEKAASLLSPMRRSARRFSRSLSSRGSKRGGAHGYTTMPKESISYDIDPRALHDRSRKKPTRSYSTLSLRHVQLPDEDAVTEAERERFFIIQELVQGEEAACTNMFHVYQIYDKSSTAFKLFTDEQRDIIFTNYMEIRQLSEDLLMLLNNRQSSALPNIGRALMAWLPMARGPYAIYCSGQRRSKHLLRALKHDKNRDQLLEFDKLASRCHEAHGRELDAMLDFPRTRMAGYKLFVSRLLKETPKDHPEYSDLLAAEQLCHETVSYINNVTRDSLADRATELAESLDRALHAPDPIMTPLLFYCTGQRVDKAHKSHPINLYLFDTHILATKFKSKAADAKMTLVAKPIPVLHLTPVDTTGDDGTDEEQMQLAMTVQAPVRGGSLRRSTRRSSLSSRATGFIVKFDRLSDKMDFLEAFQRLKRELEELCREHEAGLEGDHEESSGEDHQEAAIQEEESMA
ncbi:uncharacterized protein MONBRDRAFT_12062 [Monosiga brevicollis MX1]|uniref:DH domain-containing protein n=1 Tax=Monosiga brevicollis TaxID=81824 RepID=A9VB40_MONBE|nr:uncharacterized protein MONBRDRAFT_12062 [Monosiga brevicollis MX1]EDQ85273.1 predicted protein [Monosiga brevicollis MX1]|eukprot:XP_001749894.1 hypothetical protein [Monosiga brevicollis MX1]